MFTKLSKTLSQTRPKGDATERIEKEIDRIRRVRDVVRQKRDNEYQMNTQLIVERSQVGPARFIAMLPLLIVDEDEVTQLVIIDEDEIGQFVFGEISFLLKRLQFDMFGEHGRVDARVNLQCDDTDVYRRVEHEKTRRNENEHLCHANRLRCSCRETARRIRIGVCIRRFTRWTRRERAGRRTTTPLWMFRTDQLPNQRSRFADVRQRCAIAVGFLR
jgi:hypothetical protein